MHVVTEEKIINTRLLNERMERKTIMESPQFILEVVNLQ